MNRFLSDAGMATRLIVGLVFLIVITTLSAGVPVFLLARAQLENQARQQVIAAQRATQSLYLAEQGNSVDLTELLAERPTLRQLVSAGELGELERYLRIYQAQSDFDFIQICGLQTMLISLGDGPPLCASIPGSGYEILDRRPVLLANQAIDSDNSTGLLGRVVTGKWLDDQSLRQISETTGARHSLLSPERERLATTLPPGEISAGRIQPDGDEAIGALSIEEAPFYTAELVLQDRLGTEGLIAEIALPVGDLVQTEQRALLILAASTGLIALLGVILGTWYIRRITAPLQQLTATAERISRGDLAATLPEPSGPPEIATLSASLEKSQATMLQILAERSQDRDWLNSLVQSVVEGVITFDTRGRVTFLSQGAELMTGWSAEEALGEPINTILPLADPREETFLDHIPPVGDKREIEVLTRGGKRMILATTGSRMVPPDSDTVQVALVLRDVTEEQALRNLRSFFLANISHEFRTPLSTLNASMELLMEQADDMTSAEIRELLKPTHLSLVSLQTLIDNLLESSSIEAGSFTLRKHLVSLNEVITDALAIVRPLVDRRRQKIAVTEPALLPRLIADRARLTQALVNLLANASKYSPTGEPIDLLLEQSDGMLRVAVADRGPGITPEDRVNLFRLFRRLHEESNEQYGVGLGLYLVKRIAEAHGGQVGVDDRPGGGAIFWMDFPVEPNEKDT